MTESDIEHGRVTLADWPDGSRVTVDRYRSDVIAPWAYGPYEGYCGSCRDHIVAEATEQDARIRLLEHLLFHAFEEIQEITRWIKASPDYGQVSGTRHG